MTLLIVVCGIENYDISPFSQRNRYLFKSEYAFPADTNVLTSDTENSSFVA